MGLGGESMIAEEAIQLPLIVREASDRLTSIVNILVIDCPFCGMTILELD